MDEQKDTHFARNFSGPVAKLLLAALMSLSTLTYGQTELIKAYLVTFNDKPLQDLQPSLSEKAMERRHKFKIGLDSLDYPVWPPYVQAVCSVPGITLRYTLRWKNAAVIQVEGAVDDLDKLPFVRSIVPVGRTAAHSPQQAQTNALFNHVKNTSISTVDLDRSAYGNAAAQSDQIRLTPLHRKGLDGSGIQIGVFDAGFHHADMISAFARSRGNRQLYTVYDLVDLDPDPLSKDHHGTSVLSCMAGYQPGEYIGSAPNATFYLFRTENGPREDPLEELNWCKAAEMADSMGLDLVTSSVGYTAFDDPAYGHHFSQLDGRTTLVSHAARILTEKGVMVLTSAGNERDDRWVRIGTPADVPEVITVGAVDSKGRIGNFSSAGPNAAGVVKPDVCALGVKAYVASTYGTYYTSNGTSYSTPILAGAVACLMQANPNARPAQLAQALRSTATHNHLPDSLYGYGIANIEAAHQYLNHSATDAPEWLGDSDQLLVYNGAYSQITFSLYTTKRWLYFFKRRKLVHTNTLLSHLPFTYLPREIRDLDCSKKYTLKLEFKNAVDNYELVHNDLSWCTP